MQTQLRSGCSRAPARSLSGRGPGSRRQRGMTLIEIMVVVLIMGLIMGTVAIAVFRQLERSRVKTTRLHLARTLDAVQEWMADPEAGAAVGRCPESLQVLVPERVKAALLRDGWGRPLALQCDEERLCVTSLGSNGRDEQGGGDDLQACERRR